MLAWHFSAGLTLRGGTPIVIGETIRHDGELLMCLNGLHASQRILDALRYVPGDHLWRVRVSGEILEDKDKLVARERRVLWGGDASHILRAFSRWCALRCVSAWDPPEVVLRWLHSGDAKLQYKALAAADSAARSAAFAAAHSAAYSAATSAADSAAYSAAFAAARSAAYSAAFAAARSAAYSAAFAAARSAAYSAAYSAAFAVAFAAARSEQESQLLCIIEQWQRGQTEWVW